MDDNSIISLFWKRSEQAVRETSEKYGGLIRMMCGNILGNIEDVRECENDVYMALWNQIPPEKLDSLKNYACRIARNIAYDRYDYNHRKKRFGHKLALEELSDILVSRTLEEEYNSQELGRLLNIFLGTLEQEYRACFIYRYFYELTEKEIGSRLGMNRYAVRRRLEKTRQLLKKCLEEEGIYE